MKYNLTDEQMSMITGGYVIDVDDSNISYVVDDGDGTILATVSKSLALWVAGRKGQSVKKITVETYEKFFGRKFQPESGIPLNLGD